jgi:hypothetical protein
VGDLRVVPQDLYAVGGSVKAAVRSSVWLLRKADRTLTHTAIRGCNERARRHSTRCPPNERDRGLDQEADYSDPAASPPTSQPDRSGKRP